MKVRNHKLVGGDGTPLPFQRTPNRSGKLDGGAPRFVVIHYTAGASAQSSVSWLCNPDAKASAHLVIGRDGAVTQLGGFDEKLWHAGASSWKGLNGLNGYSVGIELANWGLLKGRPGAWLTPTGRPVPDEQVLVAPHRRAPDEIRGWEVYPEAQLDACEAAVRAICAAYGLGPEAVIGHDDISWPRKTDPGPAFPMTRLRDRIEGRSTDEPAPPLRFAVSADSGLNLRSGPGLEHGAIKLLPKGAVVAPVETAGTWWLVSEVVGGVEDTTGWVHSRWLEPA